MIYHYVKRMAAAKFLPLLNILITRTIVLLMLDYTKKGKDFHTDCCNRVLPENKVYGIVYIPNLYDRELDYRIVAVKYARVFCCRECYGKHAIQPSGLLASGDNSSPERIEQIKPYAYKFLRAVYNKIFFPKNLHR